MPPKPRVTRPSPSADKDALDSKAMPPPPVPSAPQAILEPEITALSGCLKNALVKAGQIYGFYGDTRNLKIQKHVPTPPRSLNAALGREVEKYDQLCDVLESQLLRAISVLERDIRREEQRIRDAEEAAKQLAAETKASSPPPTEAAPAPGSDAVIADDTHATSSNANPSSSPPISTTPLGRRPSAISLSSLHRPQFPLKLDLSAPSMRISGEEASLFSSGIPSPVALAPKSARPTEYHPGLMEAFASSANAIDLTQEDMNLEPQLGSSADKPIDLDLDGIDMEMDIDGAMTDLFGDSIGDSNSTDDLFSPGPKSAKVDDDSFLSSLGVGEGGEGGGSATNEDIFANLDNQNQNLSVPGGSEPSTAPSPGTMLANFAAVTSDSGAGGTNSTGGEGQFDLGSLDLEFFTQDQETDMNLMDLISMGGGSTNDNKAGETT